MTWRRHAACRSCSPDLFFPVGSGGASFRQTETAKLVCTQCPVRVSCLVWALEMGIEYGVWGGLSEDERRSWRRRQRRQRERQAARAREDVAATVDGP